ncbi:MAG: NADH-quinone oxidoreductase subunit, partial [Cryptosporangiaceae bacterium]|nr:NADH-quinone oxidoreductase subunit [Cryptosporangiaceae bacterium]
MLAAQPLAVEYTAASGALSTAWLLIALPALGAVVLLLLGRRADKWGHLLGCATVGVSFVLGLWYFFTLRGLGHRSVSLDLYTLIVSGNFKVNAGLLYDPLSAVFVLLITGVGFLIHVYSVGYMAEDPGRRRFFAYL